MIDVSFSSSSVSQPPPPLTSSSPPKPPPPPPPPPRPTHPLVFSKSYCPYCDKAKDAIRSALGQPGIAATDVWELDERQRRRRDPGGPGVHRRDDGPRVFVGGKFLGGGDDTARAAKDGTLLSSRGRPGSPFEKRKRGNVVVSLEEIHHFL